MKKDNIGEDITKLIIFYFIIVIVCIGGLSALKSIGLFRISPSDLIIVSFILPAAGILFFAAIAVPVLILLYICACIRRWKRDRRIIRQAKALGVWDKPLRLGGRALELKAWKLRRMKRQPGETDQQLRYRLAGELAKAHQAAGQPK